MLLSQPYSFPGDRIPAEPSSGMAAGALPPYPYSSCVIETPRPTLRQRPNTARPESRGPAPHYDAAHVPGAARKARALYARSEEHTSELQSLMRISYAVFCLKKKI